MYSETHSPVPPTASSRRARAMAWAPTIAVPRSSGAGDSAWASPPRHPPRRNALPLLSESVTDDRGLPPSVSHAA